MGKLKKSKNSEIDIEADGDSSGGFQNSNKQKDSKTEEETTPFVEKKRKLSKSKQSISEEETEVKVPKKKKKKNSFSEDEFNEVAAVSKNGMQEDFTVEKIKKTYGLKKSRIRVENLPWNITYEDIFEFLSKAGPVERVVLMNNGVFNTQYDEIPLRAFVIFQNFESVEKAVKLNGTELQGKKIEIYENKINKAGKLYKKNEDSSHYLNRASKNFVPTFKESKSIFIGKLDPAVDEDQLKEIFLKYGPIKSMKRISNGAFINYESFESCNAALERDNTELGGTNIFVRKQIPKAKKFKTSHHNNSSMGYMMKQIEQNILKKIQKSGHKNF